MTINVIYIYLICGFYYFVTFIDLTVWAKIFSGVNTDVPRSLCEIYNFVFIQLSFLYLFLCGTYVIGFLSNTLT